MHTIILQFAALITLGLLCQWLAWRSKLPAILLLLLVGLIFGPIVGWINPDHYFGELLFPFVSISVAIILFEGSLSLNFTELKGLGRVVRRLTSEGVLITWVLIAISSRIILNLDWPIAWLFGAIALVSGPTVIGPMLRSVRPNTRISNVLRWEGITIDPIGAMLAVLVYEYIISSQSGGAIGHTLLVFMRIILIGGGLGILAAFALGGLIRRHWLPDYLHNLATISFVMLAFGLANTIEHESGLYAVTVMGITIANMRGLNIQHIASFKEHLSIILISCLFILLAARVELQQMLGLGFPVLLLLVVIQFVIRPLVVATSTRGSNLSWQERTLIGWIAPRGIVAAAVASLFALRLEQMGLVDADMLVALTFAVIIGTVTLQSATARLLASLLGVAEPSPRGVLFVGANQVARELAKVLQQHDFQALLADTNWNNIRAARMEGLPTFYGNPVSEHADHHLEMVGLGKLMAVTPDRDVNALAMLRYGPEFGAHNIYSIVTSNEAEPKSKSSVSSQQTVQYLGARDLTYSKFASLLSKGAKLRSTQLTESYGFDDLVKDSSNSLYPLFAFDKRRWLHIFTSNSEIEPHPGWSIISLDYSQVES